MANFELGNLVWKITGDTAGFDKNIKNANTSATGLGSTLKKVGAVAVSAFAVKKVLDFGQAIITAASDAEETQNKFNVVFKDVADNAERQAKLLSDSYGLAQNEAKTLLANTGDLLTGFGFTGEAALDLSTKTQQLAADLASFTNFSGGAAGASEILTKLWLGETESAKQLGIAINQTELKRFAEEQGLVFEELTKGEKALITYELAVQQSKNAIGDFARSSDSFANQQRILNAEIQDLQTTLGTAFLPIVNDLVGVFIEFIRENEDLIISLGEGLVPVIKLIVDALSGILRVASQVLGFLFDGARASDGFADALRKQKEEQEKINDLLERAEGLKTQAEEAQNLLDTYTALNNKSNKTAEEQEELQKVIGQLGKALPSAITEWDEYGNAVAINANTANSAIDAILEARKKLLEASKARLAAQIVQSKAVKASIEDELFEARKRRDELAAQTQEQTLILAEAEKIRADRATRGFVTREESAKLDLIAIQNLAKLSDKYKESAFDAATFGNSTQILSIILQDLKRNGDSVSDALERQINETNKLEDQYAEAEKNIIEFNSVNQELNAVNNQLTKNTERLTSETRNRSQAEEQATETTKTLTAEERKRIELLTNQAKLIDEYKNKLIELGLTENELSLKQLEDERQLQLARKENTEQSVALINEYYDALLSEEKENQRIENEKKALDEFKKSWNERFSIVDQFYSGVNNIADQLFTNEQIRIENSELSEEEKAKKIATLKTKQAEADKASALVSVAIETAKNIVEAFPNPIGIALASGLGIAQTAVIAAQPIPKFANGGIVPESPSVPNTGDNVLARLNPGEEVLTRDDPRHRYNGGGITIIQNNTLNTDTQTNLERAARVLTPQIQREMSRRG